MKSDLAKSLVKVVTSKLAASQNWSSNFLETGSLSSFKFLCVESSVLEQSLKFWVDMLTKSYTKL